MGYDGESAMFMMLHASPPRKSYLLASSTLSALPLSQGLSHLALKLPCCVPEALGKFLPGDFGK